MKKITLYLLGLAFSMMIIACGGVKSAADIYTQSFIENSIKKLKLDTNQAADYTSTMTKFQELYTTMNEKAGPNAQAKSASSIRQLRNDELKRVLDQAQFEKFKKIVGPY